MDPNQQVPPQPLVSTQPLNKPRFSPSTLRLIGLSLCVLSIGIAIAVVGYLWYVSKHTSAASGQTQTKSLTTASITAWKTYTNNQYSLSFKYPNNWIESTCHHLFVFLAPKKQLLGQCPEHGGGIGYGYLIEFDMSNLQNWTDYGLPSYEDYTKALRYTDLSYLDQGKRENVTISGYPGIKISGTIKRTPEKAADEGNTLIEYVINYKNKPFIISYERLPGWDDYSETFNQIISTFKFTNGNQSTDSETSTWKTYTAKQFSIR